MKLPEEISNKILNLSYGLNKGEIAQNFRKISDRYIGEKSGKSLLNQNDEAIAYAIARMPATYGATYTACEQILEIIEKVNSSYIECFNSLIDVGTGTGAATLAISEQLKLNQITCLEREDAMIKLGKTLLSESSNLQVKNASWNKFDINNYNDNDGTLNADIVITSYMLNEFAENKTLEIVDKLWNMTNDLLIIIDPGTPEDHKRMIKVKNYLSEKGGKIIAPCTSQKGCALSENDWCNFTCRIERNKLQKEAKSGNVPYEDEKFTYLAISKNDYDLSKVEINRIIRHPIIRTNVVEVKLCSSGNIINKQYTKKDKELYKLIRKAKVGNIVEEN